MSTTTDWDAVAYNRRSALQRAMATEVLALLRLTGSERVLDVGCGNGKVTIETEERVPRGAVIGIDASPSMIEFARQSYSPQSASNLQFEVMDARACRTALSLISFCLRMHCIGYPRPGPLSYSTSSAPLTLLDRTFRRFNTRLTSRG